MKNTEISYFIGEVTEVIDSEKFSKEYHVIKADIPGVVSGITAFPRQGELDEPVPGDQILLACLDPLYNSYFIYSKLKESDFIGFRASGKMIDVTPEALSISVFDPSENDLETERPEPTVTEVKLDKDGNISVDLNKESGEIIINSGANGGAVNIGPLKDIIEMLLQGILSAGGAVDLFELGAKLAKLEDKKVKH